MAVGTPRSALRSWTATVWQGRWSSRTPTRWTAARRPPSAWASASPATTTLQLGTAGARAPHPLAGGVRRAEPRTALRVALLPITAAPDAVVAEVYRAKESGLGALMIPATRVDKEPYHDRRYDAVWAAAAECGMPVVTHSGAAPRHEYGDHLGIYVSELPGGPRAPWFLLGRASSNATQSRFGVAESGCWWLPNLLWFMDRPHPGRARRQEAVALRRAEAAPGRVPRPAALHLRDEHQAPRTRAALRDRRRTSSGAATSRTPRNLAQHPRVAAAHLPPHPGRGDPPHARSRGRRGLRLRRRVADPCSPAHGPTPADLGQSDDQMVVAASLDARARWAATGLTHHDFPVLGTTP